MTNYKYLKSLTIEELAKWLHELCDLNEIVPSEEWLSEFLKSEYVDETEKDSWEAKYLIDKENWDKMEKNLLNEIDYLRELLKQKEIKIETLIDVIRMLCK